MSLALTSCSESRSPVDLNAPQTPSAPAPKPSARNVEKPVPQQQDGHPCLVQDGSPIGGKLKAIGTEPFWSAEVEGRCIIYKTPEDQQGTRVWAKLHSEAEAQVWEGALGGRQFQLVVKPVASCSDGMSDRSYPLEAMLRVDGETRRGCAERLAGP